MLNKPSKNKHTRREAVKYGLRVGLGAAIYGTIGNLGSKVYRFGRDTYREDIKPAIEKIEYAADKINRINPFKRKPVEQINPKMTRRGLLKYLAGQAHEHPVTAGTIAGATYGAGKYSLRHLSTYLTKREVAKLKDENIGYQERVRILENYRNQLERDALGRDRKLAYVETELQSVKQILEGLGVKPNRLEESVEGSSHNGEDSKDHTRREPKRFMLLIIGATGLLISIILSSTALTGNAILNIAKVQTMSLSMALFAVSLVLIFIGMKKRVIKSN